MEESILLTIKDMLGIEPGYKHFDKTLIVFINMALNVLNQLGVGPDETLEIIDENDIWSDLTDDDTNLAMCKQFIFIKVKLGFDPPLNSSLIQMYERQLNELAWRLNVEVDHE